jgi:hypothetical protein
MEEHEGNQLHGKEYKREITNTMKEIKTTGVMVQKRFTKKKFN